MEVFENFWPSDWDVDVDTDQKVRRTPKFVVFINKWQYRNFTLAVYYISYKLSRTLYTASLHILVRYVYSLQVPQTNQVADEVIFSSVLHSSPKHLEVESKLVNIEQFQDTELPLLTGGPCVSATSAISVESSVDQRLYGADSPISFSDLDNMNVQDVSFYEQNVNTKLYNECRYGQNATRQQFPNQSNNNIYVDMNDNSSPIHYSFPDTRDEQCNSDFTESFGQTLS